MFSLNFVLIVAICQAQAGKAQYFLPHNGPFTDSLSRASSTASERQLQLGGLGLSRGFVDSQSVTTNNGGYGYGGTTAITDSRSRTGGLNLGGLNIGSTLTASQTRRNGDVSRGLAHNLNLGGLGIGSSLSRDNLQHGFGLQRSQNGGLKLGLGLLNFDLSRSQHQYNAQALTQAQAQAQGEDAFSRSNSNTNSLFSNFGGLGVKTTHSHSNALSGSRFGQSSAHAGGLGGGAAGNVNSFGFFRTRRATEYTNPRPKRRAEFIPFFYPGNAFNSLPNQLAESASLFPDFGYQHAHYPQKRSTNAESLANSQSDNYEQQASANTQAKEEENENGVLQNNAASSIGSNLATNGYNGQLSSANVNQDNSQTGGGSQSSNNAQSQALNFEQNQQQAANANVGTKQVETENGKTAVAHGGSQATNSNEYGSSSNIANTNSQAYEEGDTRGSQADSSSQSILQGNNGQNSAAHTNANVKSVQGPDGFVSNSATSHATAVSRGGQGANAVATASASSNSGSDGNNGFSNASGNADNFGNFFGLGGAQANSGAFGDFNGARGFANGHSGFQAFKIRKRKSPLFNTQLRQQQQNQTSSLLSTLEIINDSKEINWPRNRIQLYNHYPQQQPQLPRQREQQQPQQKHPQQLHYSSINPNSSTEQFAVIDENERHGRTFTFITDLINSFLQPTCIYPCTLEAYQQNRCCETAVLLPQPPPNVCCAAPWPPSILHPSTTIIRPPAVLPTSSLQPPQPTLTFPLIPTQCCSICPAFGFYGPPPCIRYTFPREGPGSFSLFMG